MLVIVIAGLYLLVFARALVAYLRSRDRLQGAVALVFTAVAVLFFLQLVRTLVGEVPWAVRTAAALLLLAQPLFTLRLAALIRPVSRYVRWLAMLGWYASAAAVVLLPAPLPLPARVGVTGCFAATELAAAAYLAVEVRRRTGAPRVRLAAAAGGTALFAVALLITLAGASPTLVALSRGVALASAVAYVAAFLPPRWMRRWWSARAAYTLMGRMLGAPGTGSPEQTWRNFADTVLGAVDADAAVVVALDPGGGAQPVAVAGRDPGGIPAGDLARLVHRAAAAARGPEPGRGLAARSRDGDGHVTIIPLALHAGGTGALVVLFRHLSLFTEDDVALLADLGRQAAVLADRDVLTAKLRDTVAALRAANEAKSDFLAAMSHELRTPLNAIIGFSELMGDEESDGDRRLVPEEWIANVHSSGRHLLGLINDLLDLAKVEAGRVELRAEPLDVASAVAEAVAPLRPLLDAKRLRLTVAVPPVAIHADRLRMRQMLNNLLSNAIKFTPEDGSVFVSAHRAGAYTHVSVADTGPGIDAADQQRVFEEFHQSGDAESRAGGTGLGLTLTRRLAEAHGGRIELHSQVGHGSRFTLVLPAAESGEPRAAAGAGHATRPPAEASGGILVVEDDPSAAHLLSTYLSAAGYPVTCVGTGEAGLDAARRCAPEVILLDVLLPGMDGWEVLQRLKSDDRLRHIPVAMVTVVDEREVGLALGAVDYFVKPVERGALLAWLARHGLVPPLTPRRPAVLVVDADPVDLAAVERCLGAEGLDVTTATTGGDALRLAGARHFDLVICDLLLPDHDGFTFLTALHDNPVTRDTPVVVLTSGDLSEPDKARLAGKILGVVAKAELDPAELCVWLERATHPLIPAAPPDPPAATAARTVPAAVTA